MLCLRLCEEGPGKGGGISSAGRDGGGGGTTTARRPIGVPLAR